MIPIPGTIFTKTYRGWTMSFAFIRGALKSGYRVCIENPKSKIFVTFFLSDYDIQLLDDSIRIKYRDKEKPNVPPSK